MLLKAEDQATFHSRLEKRGAESWASFRVEDRVSANPVSQGDERMFASEEEARKWLVGEAERRGFHAVEPETRSAA
jgi:hypothetical protein